MIEERKRNISSDIVAIDLRDEKNIALVERKTERTESHRLLTV
jgi:hypothetical protein